MIIMIINLKKFLLKKNDKVNTKDKLIYLYGDIY